MCFQSFFLYQKTKQVVVVVVAVVAVVVLAYFLHTVLVILS